MANLAPPTPYQWSVGDIGSASLLNAQLYNGLTFLENPPIFVGLQTVTQSIGTSNTMVTFDTNVYDTYGGHSTSSNTTRYTCQQAGYYTICGVVCYSANSTGARGAHICVNGNPIQGHSSEVPAVATYLITVPTPTRDVYLNAGDYVELQAWQSSGAALSTAVASDQASALWAHFSHV